MDARTTKLLESIHEAFSTDSHLSRLAIRISRAVTLALKSLSRNDVDEIEKAHSRLTNLLLELIEVLEDQKSPTTSKIAIEAQDFLATIQRSAASRKGPTTPELRRKTSDRVEIASPTLDHSIPSTVQSSIDSLLALESSQSNVFPSKALADCHMLFLLTNFPSKNLLAGKSLVSLLQEDAEEELVPKEELSSDLATLYLDQFASRLSSSSFSDIDEQWSQLLNYIWSASKPVIPSRVKAKVSLQSEFTSTSTSFSVSNAVASIHRLLSTLSQLAAPVRDAQIHSLLLSISSPVASTSSSSPSSHSTPPSTLLPSTSLDTTSLVEAIRELLALLKLLQSDLANFKRNVLKVTPPTESELRDIMKIEAEKRELEAVSNYYSQKGLIIKEAIKEWVCQICQIEKKVWEGMDLSETKQKIGDGLIEMIFGDVAVEFPSSFSTISSNTLPPIFIVPSPEIFNLQNRVQALIILACLLSLISSSSTITAIQGEEMIERLWIILTFESKDGKEETTKLINLSDEIISTLRKSNLEAEIQIDEEQRIRDSVQRILRYEDPVYKLLKNRLLVSLKESLRRIVENGSHNSVEVPSVMRTGIMPSTSREVEVTNPTPQLVAKGFEKGRKFSQEILSELESIFLWSSKVWSNTI